MEVVSNSLRIHSFNIVLNFLPNRFCPEQYHLCLKVLPHSSRCLHTTLVASSARAYQYTYINICYIQNTYPIFLIVYLARKLLIYTLNKSMFIYVIENFIIPLIKKNFLIYNLFLGMFLKQIYYYFKFYVFLNRNLKKNNVF
jgi:hypothetical protein